MKKVLLLILIMLSSLLLPGCITKTYNFEDLNIENIQSISFYDLSGEECKDTDTILRNKPFYEMDNSKYEEFLTQLKKIKFAITLILIAANDPSFTYSSYVVRFEFKDSSYKFLSSNGYNQTFTSDGEYLKGDHFSCYDYEWNNLIYSFCGRISSRICVDKSYESVLTVVDNVTVMKILYSKKLTTYFETYKFTSKEYLYASDGNKYYICNNKINILKMNNEYYKIDYNDAQELKRIIEKYNSYLY